jgi:hypothetical protein
MQECTTRKLQMCYKGDPKTNSRTQTHTKLIPKELREHTTYKLPPKHMH